MSDWNARCGKLGKSRLLNGKALTKYWDEYRGNGAKLTPDDGYRSNTVTNSKEMALS